MDHVHTVYIFYETLDHLTALLLMQHVGKTLTARILASRCERPLVSLQVNNILSKWYGESEQKLTQILDLCDAMDGTIIFIDEIDALAGTRDSGELHEASRRVLSIILQRLEGFQGKSKSLLICATNRPQDLDSAMLSRFDLTISYPLPDMDTRIAIFSRYARQFLVDSRSKLQLERLAHASAGLSCREIKEICEHAERMWASKKIASLNSTKKSNTTKSSGISNIRKSSSSSSDEAEDTPSLDDYLYCIRFRKESISVTAGLSHHDGSAVA